jgi:oligosaccharyltransferase complex subunit delta (ribophorin II)
VATLKAVIKDTNSLLEFYYSVGGLLSIKVTASNALFDTSLLLMAAPKCLIEFYVVIDIFFCFFHLFLQEQGHNVVLSDAESTFHAIKVITI